MTPPIRPDQLPRADELFRPVTPEQLPSSEELFQILEPHELPRASELFTQQPTPLQRALRAGTQLPQPDEGPVSSWDVLKNYLSQTIRSLPAFAIGAAAKVPLVGGAIMAVPSLIEATQEFDIDELRRLESDSTYHVQEAARRNRGRTSIRGGGEPATYITPQIIREQITERIARLEGNRAAVERMNQEYERRLGSDPNLNQQARVFAHLTLDHTPETSSAEALLNAARSAVGFYPKIFAVGAGLMLDDAVQAANDPNSTPHDVMDRANAFALSSGLIIGSKFGNRAMRTRTFRERQEGDFIYSSTRVNPELPSGTPRLALPMTAAERQSRMINNNQQTTVQLRTKLGIEQEIGTLTPEARSAIIGRIEPVEIVTSSDPRLRAQLEAESIATPVAAITARHEVNPDRVVIAPNLQGNSTAVARSLPARLQATASIIDSPQHGIVFVVPQSSLHNLPGIREFAARNGFIPGMQGSWNGETVTTSHVAAGGRMHVIRADGSTRVIKRENFRLLEGVAQFGSVIETINPNAENAIFERYEQMFSEYVQDPVGFLARYVDPMQQTARPVDVEPISSEHRLKLMQGGAGDSEGFLKEVQNLGYPNPINPRELVIGNQAAIELRNWEGGINIASIRAFEQRKGIGTKVMKKLANLADYFNVRLSLAPEPFETSKGKIPKEKLIEFYRRFGFESDPRYADENYEMVRYPSRGESVDKKLAAEQQPINIMISTKAYELLGLDDSEVFTNRENESVIDVGYAFDLPVADVRRMIDDLETRASPIGGFEHTEKERRILKFSAQALRRQLAQQSKPLTSEQRTGEGTVGAGFDRSLFKKLGENMYQGDLGVVALKEGLQNAIDSMRENSGGKVEVSYKDGQLTITDDGIGMSPDVMSTAFMDIGGSAKDSLTASGGYGLAKVALFSRAAEIFASSTASVAGKKIRTEIEGTGADWAEGTLKIREAEVDIEHPTGTILRLKFDKNPESWKMTHFYRKARQYSTVPLKFEGGIEFELPENRKSVPVVQDPLIVFDEPGAKITLRRTEQMSDPGSTAISTVILNRGMYQFDFATYVKSSIGLPHAVVVDVEPTVDINDSNYPFTTSRDQLKNVLKEKVQKWIMDAGGLATIKENSMIVETIKNSPKIAGTKFSVVPDDLSIPEHRELAVRIAAHPSSKIFSKVVASMMESILAVSRYKTAMFGGLGLSKTWLGRNVLTTGLVLDASTDAEIKLAIRDLAKAQEIDDFEVENMDKSREMARQGIPRVIVNDAGKVRFATPQEANEFGGSYVIIIRGPLGGDPKEIMVFDDIAKFMLNQQEIINGPVASPNIIYWNPYSTYYKSTFDPMYSGRALFPKIEDQATYMAEQAWATMIHEVAHQESRYHDENFSSAMTDVMAAISKLTASEVKKASKQFLKVLSDPSFLRLYNDVANSWRADRSRSIFEKISSTRRSDSEGDISERNDERVYDPRTEGYSEGVQETGTGRENIVQSGETGITPSDTERSANRITGQASGYGVVEGRQTASVQLKNSLETRLRQIEGEAERLADIYRASGSLDEPAIQRMVEAHVEEEMRIARRELTPPFTVVTQALANELKLPDPSTIENYIDQQIAKKAGELYLTPYEKALLQRNSEILAENYGGLAGKGEVADVKGKVGGYSLLLSQDNMPLTLYARTNGMDAQLTPTGLYVIRDLNTGDVIGQAATVDNAKKLIDQFTQVPGTQLVTKGVSALAVTGAGGTLVPPEPPRVDPMDGYKLPYEPPGKGRVTRWLQAYGRIRIPWMALREHRFESVANRYNIPDLSQGFRESQRIVLARDAAVTSGFERYSVKSMDEMQSDLTQARREEVYGAQETASADELYKKLTPIESEISNNILDIVRVSSGVDIPKTLKFVRRLGQLKTLADEGQWPQKKRDDALATLFKVSQLSISEEAISLRILPMIGISKKAAQIYNVARYVQAVIDNAPNQSDYMKQKNFSGRETALVHLLRAAYNNAAKEFGIDFNEMIQFYAPHIRNSQDVMPSELRAAFFDISPNYDPKKYPPNFNFWYELTRTGELSVYERDPVVAFVRYLRAGIAKPFNEQMKAVTQRMLDAANRIPDNAERTSVIQEINDYASRLKGTPELGRQALTEQMTQITNEMRRTAGLKETGETRAINKILNFIDTYPVIAFQGFRPGQGFRDLTSVLGLSFIRFGPKVALGILKDATWPLEENAQGELNRGKVSEHIDRLKKAGIISQGFNPLDLTQAVGESTAQIIGGRAMSGIRKLSDFTMRASLQSQVYDLMSAGTYKYGRELALNTLREFVMNRDNPKTITKKLQLDAFAPTFVKEFIGLVEKGNIDQASDIYGRQMIRMILPPYGHANMPYGWSSVAGNLLSRFGFYSMFTHGVLNDIMEFGDANYTTKALARFAAFDGFLQGGAAATGYDMRRWALWPALIWGGSPQMQMISKAATTAILSNPLDALIGLGKNLTPAVLRDISKSTDDANAFDALLRIVLGIRRVE